MTSCRICNSSEIITLMDFGMQPICNRFIKLPAEQEYNHSLIIGLCKSCGLIQLLNPFPAIELQPNYDWITYTEPEEHLDNLADIISKLLK